MPTEAELKFSVDPRHASDFARQPALVELARQVPITARMRSIYFDTPNADLRKARMTLRLRRIGRRWWQTLKGDDAGSGVLHLREESEQALASGALDLEHIGDARLRKRLRRWASAGDLVPRFETVIRRTTWQLRTADGASVECALDRGHVRTIDGRRTSALCELELELKEGSNSALFTLAREFGRSMPLIPDARSKAERGYALWRREPPGQPVRWAPPHLPAHASESVAAALIMGSGLAQLQRNWQAATVSARYVPEHVHQMRVAARRLRTAFTTFGQIDPSIESHPLMGELGWLADLLGEARNWDVLLMETLPKVVAAFPDEPALRALMRKAQSRRRVARAAVVVALRSDRHRSLMLNLSEFVMDTRENARLAMPARPFAAAMLAKRYKQLRRRARNLAALSSLERHSLRIAAKKVRYNAEFFGSLFARRKRDPFLERFGKLQNELGVLNDLATARVLMSALFANSSTDTQRALALCTGWSAGLEEGHLAEMTRCWKDVERCAPFWPRDPATVAD